MSGVVVDSTVTPLGDELGGLPVPPLRPLVVFAVAAAALLMPVEDRDLLAIAAERIMPPDRSAPSAWAEARIELSADQTARPGKFSADVLCFQRAAMDAHFHEPEKLGVIAPKCAQIGWTLLELMDVAYCQSTDPGPELQICCDDLKAKEYCFERFVPLVKSSGSLQKVVDEAGTDKKIIGYGVHFPGGKVTFAWATSEKRVIGTPFKRVRIDDAEASFDAYPSKAGDLFVSVQTRTETYRGVRKININGHPRHEDSGIWALYWHKSDRRVWTIDCPHEGCSRPVAMRWRHVHYRGTIDGRPDPATAELRCPHCGGVIGDVQRARALWPARANSKSQIANGKSELAAAELGAAGRVGGTGRYESELSPEEAARRPFIGLHTTRLCDHRVSVVELARQLAECGDDAGKVLDVMNKVIGEPQTRAGAIVLDDRHLDELRSAERDAPSDVVMLTVGVDVQKGPTGESGPPGLYVVGVAWTRSQTAVVVDARTMVGWAALWEHLRSLCVRIPVGDGKTFRLLPPSWCGIDVAYLTAQSLGACRETIYTGVAGEHAGARINLAGLRYMNTVVGPDRVWAEAPMEKRIWRDRPELGPVDYLYLHRHSWVDRTFRRLAEKRLRMFCPEPPAWREHLNANFLAPVKKQHDWETPRLEWDKAKQVRDDYARCLDYAEAVAAIRGGLDGIGLGPESTGMIGFTFGERAGTEQQYEEGGRW